MNNFRYIALSLVVLIALLVVSCKSDSPAEYADIRIGKGEQLSEIELSKETMRSIILSGGNAKYSVQVENSQIVSASIAQDTLRIRALLEGETYATITSHDRTARLTIKVKPHELYLSQEEIRLYPKAESKQVRLTGGGDIVTLVEDDPEDALTYKWNGNTGILELQMAHEADASLVATSQDGKQKRLRITARLDGSTELVGFYDTSISSQTYIPPSPIMVVYRPKVGVWLMTGTRPNDRNTTTTTKLSPIVNPIQGEMRTLVVDIRRGSIPSHTIESGTYQVRVEEVREQHVVVRGKGFKYVVPYDKD